MKNVLLFRLIHSRYPPALPLPREKKFNFRTKVIFILDGYQKRNFTCLFIRPQDTFTYTFGSWQSEGDKLDMHISWDTYKMIYYSDGWSGYNYGAAWQLNFLNTLYYYVAF